MPSVNLATDHLRVASGASALVNLKKMGILTSAVVGAITSSGTTAKLITALDARYAVVAPGKMQDDFLRSYQRALTNLKTAIRAKVLTDAMVEAARALSSGDKADKLIADFAAVHPSSTNPDLTKGRSAMIE